MARNHYYVDYSGGNDTTGDGSTGTPWKTIQKALDTITHTTADISQINLKSNANHVLTAKLSFATIASSQQGYPILFMGYTTTAGDKGQATVDGAGTAIVIDAVRDAVLFAYVNFISASNADTSLITLDNFCMFYRCSFTCDVATILNIGTQARIVNCEISGSASSYLLLAGDPTFLTGCTLEQTHASGTCVYVAGQGVIINNTIRCTSSGYSGVGIWYRDGNFVANNSIFGVAATGDGIEATSSSGNYDDLICINNIVEGFSGTGGTGVNVVTGGLQFLIGNNGFFNNATDFSNSGIVLLDESGSDVSFSASPFSDATNGDFEVTDVLAKNAALPHLSQAGDMTDTFDIGAYQSAFKAGGGGTSMIGPGGGMIGRGY